METILTRKQFEDQYTGWGYGDVIEDYKKYLEYHKKNRKEFLINEAKKVINYHLNNVFGCDYLSDVDFNDIEKLIETLDDLNGLLGVDYTLYYDGVKQDIGCLSDDLRIEFNL